MDKEVVKIIDYSSEVKLVRNPLLRALLFTTSCLCLVLALIGIFVPVLPTTPLVILAAFLYTKCSARFYNILMNHRRLGPPLRHWRQTGSIPVRAKLISISMLWLALGSSIVYFIPIFFVKVLMGIIGLGVTYYVLSRPSR